MTRANTFFHATLATWLLLATTTAWSQDTAGKPTVASSAPLQLRDGDRVVFLGGTFIERMQNYGYLETLLTAAHPGKHITFRNLGWSGDTVWGESRGVFGTATEGFQRLVKDVSETKPTVIVICYGANEANAGAGAVPKFVAGLNRLLDALVPTQARFLLVSPPKREKPAPPLPDPHTYNEVLGQYVKAIAHVASDRKAACFDLYAQTAEIPPTADQVTTSNGMHYSEFGDWYLAPRFAQAFGVQLLTVTAPTSDATESAVQWQRLRQTIIDKNVLYFYRHRPQNETYLLLFRKHEQGNNAVEIPQFDPLVAEKEKQLAALPKPKIETYFSIKIGGKIRAN